MEPRIIREIHHTWYGARVDVKVPHTEGDGLGTVKILSRRFFHGLDYDPRIEAQWYADYYYQKSSAVKSYAKRYHANAG